MFDYLLKQFAGKQKKSEQKNEDRTEVEKPLAQLAKRNALLKAEQLSGSDEEILAFLLQCSFADARFIAAQKIRSKDTLEQVRAAMRNTDRRVVRLVQTRLDEISRRDIYQRKVRECIEDGKKLIKENLITPNLVAELDRRWKPVSHADGIDHAMRREFDSVRQEISARLTAQAEMQRRVMGWVDELHGIRQEEGAMTPDERAEKLNQLESKMKACLESREASSLPRHLLISFDHLLQELREKSAAHKQHYNAYEEREKILVEWEETPQLNLLLIQKQWDSLPRLTGLRMAEMQERFNALLRREPEPAQQTSDSALSEIPETVQEKKARFLTHLAALELAVQDGSIQQTTQNDDAISNLMDSALPLNEEETERLNRARNAMRHLQGWARWGGQMAYDELIRRAEELPQQELSTEELANVIVDLRKNWKMLNATSGPALKNQWQKFHDACNRAYEPVLNKAREAAEKRDQNIAQAKAIIETVREFMANAGLHSTGDEDKEMTGDKTGFNWKNLAVFQRNTMNTWRQLGQINRKDRKGLDAEFDALMHPLRECLNQRTQEEISYREELIEKAGRINPEDRNAGKALRELQDRWQEKARQFPLENRDDQKLWQRFRAACEAVHTQRLKVNEIANEERQQNLQLKEAICTRLETETAGEIRELTDRLCQAEENWNAIGDAPKDKEGVISDRYRKAVDAIRAQIQKKKENQQQQHVQLFFEKLALCQEMEMAIGRMTDTDSWISRWQSLPQLDGSREGLLRPRWEAGIKALEKGDLEYVALLDQNSALLLEKLLCLEIIMGQDSPPEFAQERLKAQIEVLQDSLSGANAIPREKLLEELCQLPARTDEKTAARLISLLKK